VSNPLTSWNHVALSVGVSLAAAVFASAILAPTPTSASSDSARRGAELFASTGCVHCHGSTRLGTERGPNLTQVRRRLKPAAIAAQIHGGGKAMPPFGDQLTQQQIADLVDFLRARQK
jgi:mono/diheme cytochrome c family protein